MRTLFPIATLFALTTPAAAKDCYWLNGEIWCHPACHVTDRWISGNREWMQWSCGLTPDEMRGVALLVAGVGLIIIIAIIGAVASAAASNAHATDIAQIEEDMAADEEIKQDMEVAMRNADAHIAAMLAKYRKGE